MEDFYQELKTEYVNLVKQMIKEMNGVLPGIAVSATEKKTNQTNFIFIEIPKEALDSVDNKEILFEEALPKIGKIISENRTINAVAWSSEAWYSTEENVAPSRSKNRKEVVFMLFESKDRKDHLIYEMIRTHSVNAEGELEESVELHELSEESKQLAENSSEGRMSNLYEKITSLIENN